MSEIQENEPIFDGDGDDDSQNESIVDENDNDDDLSEMSDLNDELEEMENEEDDDNNLNVPGAEDDEQGEEIIDINENSENDELNSDDDDDDDDDDYEGKYQKFEHLNIDNYLSTHYSHLKENNIEEIKALSKVIRDKENNIIDDLHKTVPILTKYEKARIIGVRASQINSGANIMVKPHKPTFDGYLIAEQELSENKIPFIIKRPLPNGNCEYWKLQDLEVI